MRTRFEWLDGMAANELNSKAVDLPKIGKGRLRQMIEWYIEPFGA
jgi:hypothetical protein